MEGVFAVLLLTLGTAEMKFFGDMHLPFTEHAIQDARKLKDALNTIGGNTKHIHVLEIKKKVWFLSIDYDGIYIDNSPDLKTSHVCHIRWQTDWTSLRVISRVCEPLSRKKDDDDEDNGEEDESTPKRKRKKRRS